MKYFLGFLLLTFCRAPFAQNIVANGKTLPLVGYWHTGAKKNVLYTKVTSKERLGIITSETIAIKALWQVKDSTDKSYTFHYTYRDFTFSNPKDSLNIAFAEIFKGVTVKYRTSELGIFDTILNLDEIIALSRKGIDGILKKLMWPDNDVTKPIIDNMKSVLNNSVILENNFKEDLVLIHYFYGLEYTLNTPYSYDSYLENNLGGEVFPAKVVFKLTSINAPKDRAKFNATYTPDPKEYKRILFETYSNLASEMQLSMPGKTDFETATTVHKCEAETTIVEGWPVKVTFTKVTNMQGTKSTDLTTITLNN